MSHSCDDTNSALPKNLNPTFLFMRILFKDRFNYFIFCHKFVRILNKDAFQSNKYGMSVTLALLSTGRLFAHFGIETNIKILLSDVNVFKAVVLPILVP